MTQGRFNPAASPTQGGLDERQLLEKVRSGDASGQRLFYERYVGYLTAVCARYIVDREAVKDILQDSFVRIFGKIGEFEYRGEGSVRAWVTRIVVNDSLKALRGAGKLKYVDDLPDSREDEEEISSLPKIPPSVLQEMIRALPDGIPRGIQSLRLREEVPQGDRRPARHQGGLLRFTVFPCAQHACQKDQSLYKGTRL